MDGEALLISLATMPPAPTRSIPRHRAAPGRTVRRRAVRCVWLTTLLLGIACAASAQFPERDIEIIVPFDAGGGFDTYVRALAPWIEKHLDNRVRVVPRNAPGAGGGMGTNDVFRARPDGYTIGAFNLPGVLIPQLQDIGVGYDLGKITWIATLSDDPYVYAVRTASPLTSIQMAIDEGRTLLYSATGPGSTAYVATTIVNARLGIPFEVVTGYTGSSAYLVGLLRGDVDAVLVNLSAARPYLASNDIRALAVFGTDSGDSDVADAASLGAPELARLNLVRMIGAPPGLPHSVRRMLEAALLAALEEPEFVAWLAATGNTVNPAGADATEAAVRDMAQFYEQFKPLLD
jgi:tripartite-type tricarboxylate transporter receptor subunit TctC